jgi:8-oxo-dGTP pyrophosphatase MutT (NUDIX family)
MSPADFETFIDRARVRLRPAPPEPDDLIARPRSDYDLQPEFRPEDWSEAALKPAAVLVPVVRRDQGATLLLTQRAATLRDHSAQIAFPGGRVDEDDAGPIETALREAEEEIGLERRHVTPIGFLDAYLTGTGYRIVPVVALVSPAFVLNLNAAEVDDAFETPLSFLMDPANHRTEGREWRGHRRTYYAMPWSGRYIWGATAGIIRNLHDRVLGAQEGRGEQCCAT